MKVSSFIFLLSLLAGTLFNFDNAVMRMVALLAWSLFPLIVIYFTTRNSFLKSELLELTLSVLFVCYFLMSMLINASTLSLSITGASAELLSPILIVFHGIQVFACNRFIKKNKGDNYILINGYFWTVILLLCIDMVYRYITNSNCFMNYMCRYEAKTIGFFSTTNVTGQTLSFLICISWYIGFYKRALAQSIMLILLITTMARSAMLALAFAFIIHSMFFSNRIIIRLFSVIFVIAVSTFLFLDPMDLRQDGSGQSKVDFFSSVYTAVMSGSLSQLLFGFGASFEYVVNLVGVNGWSPHASVLKAILYYGFFGLLIFFLFLARMILYDKKLLAPIICFLIFGLAGAPIYWPTLTIGLIVFALNNSNVKTRYK